MSEQKDLVPQAKMPIAMLPDGVDFKTFEDCYRVARVIAQSGFAPKDLKTPEACAVAILYGREIGLSAMQSVQNVAPINGKPCIYGDAALGLVMSKGAVEEFNETWEGVPYEDNFRGVCKAKRTGVASPFVYEFSVKDAKLAGLWGKQGPWSQYPKRMLQMRARGFLLRNAFPDILKGLIAREEAQDYPTKEAPRDAQVTVRDVFAPPKQQDVAYNPVYVKHPAPATPAPEPLPFHPVAEVPETPQQEAAMVDHKPDTGAFYEEIEAFVNELAKMGRPVDLDLAVVSLMDDKEQEQELLKLQKIYEDVLNEK